LLRALSLLAVAGSISAVASAVNRSHELHGTQQRCPRDCVSDAVQGKAEVVTGPPSTNQLCYWLPWGGGSAWHGPPRGRAQIGGKRARAAATARDSSHDGKGQPNSRVQTPPSLLFPTRPDGPQSLPKSHPRRKQFPANAQHGDAATTRHNSPNQSNQTEFLSIPAVFFVRNSLLVLDTQTGWTYYFIKCPQKMTEGSASHSVSKTGAHSVIIYGYNQGPSRREHLLFERKIKLNYLLD
jgi:hypothetical protein